jgi:TRAP transporter TAXI family solute receptor
MNRRSLLAVPPLALLAACSSGEPDPSGPLRIATGSQTAVYYLYGGAIASLIRQRLPNVQPTVLVTAASQQNVKMVLEGSAEVGFTQADIAADNAADTPNGPAALTALARLYDDYVHLVVRRTGPIGSLADLIGRKVSIGAPGSGTGITAKRLLTVGLNGLPGTVNRQEYGLDDSVAALRDGRIDAFFFSGGLPVQAIASLAQSVTVRLVDLHDYVERLRARYGEYYADRVVPRSTYSGVEATQTIGIPNYLVVKAGMAESMAFALTKLLFNGRDTLAKAHPAGARLNVRSAISTPPVNLHPGAARYYRSVKA